MTLTLLGFNVTEIPKLPQHALERECDELTRLNSDTVAKAPPAYVASLFRMTASHPPATG
jgi:hypothetical protein